MAIKKIDQTKIVKFQIDFRLWVLVFPITSVIITCISYNFPVFIFHDVVWNPFPAVLDFDMNLLGVINGDNFKKLLILIGEGDVIPLMSLPGNILGTATIIINVLLILSVLLVILIKRVTLKVIAKYILILGVFLLISMIIYTTIWSFAGEYILSEIDSTHVFWGDSAKIKLGLILPFISGSLPIVGYVIIRTKYFKK